MIRVESAALGLSLRHILAGFGLPVPAVARAVINLRSRVDPHLAWAGRSMGRRRWWGCGARRRSRCRACGWGSCRGRRCIPRLNAAMPSACSGSRRRREGRTILTCCGYGGVLRMCQRRQRQHDRSNCRQETKAHLPHMLRLTMQPSRKYAVNPLSAISGHSLARVR